MYHEISSDIQVLFKKNYHMNKHNEYGQPIGFSVEDWDIKKKPDSKKILVGRLCQLEPLIIEKHAESLHQIFWETPSSASWTYLPYGPFHQQEELILWMNKILNEEGTQMYAIIDKASKKPIGLSGYLRINPEHGVIEVGHLHFSSRLKKTPLATEAMYLMMHYVFEELGYRRYEWKCHSLNEASKNAALRLGFQFEGIFRQSNVFKGHNRDTAWFSILDHEWPSLKENFESWLQPNNFDENGQQKRKLNEPTTTGM